MLILPMLPTLLVPLTLQEELPYDPFRGVRHCGHAGGQGEIMLFRLAGLLQ
jgi:hypothetical protein